MRNAPPHCNTDALLPSRRPYRQRRAGRARRHTRSRRSRFPLVPPGRSDNREALVQEPGILARDRRRHGGRCLPQGTALARSPGGGVAVGGNGRQSRPPRAPPGLDRRSDRRHARLCVRRSGLVRLPSAFWPRAAPCSASSTLRRTVASTRPPWEAGATRNGAPLKVSDRTRLDGARVAGPKPLQDALERRAGSLDRLPKIPSLALRLARVAEGSLDVGLVSANSCDWDLAGADLILQEAGGWLTGFDGTPMAYNQPEPIHGELAAAPSQLHPRVIEAMRSRRPGRHRTMLSRSNRS